MDLIDISSSDSEEENEAARRMQSSCRVLPSTISHGFVRGSQKRTLPVDSNVGSRNKEWTRESFRSEAGPEAQFLPYLSSRGSCGVTRSQYCGPTRCSIPYNHQSEIMHQGFPNQSEDGFCLDDSVIFASDSNSMHWSKSSSRQALVDKVAYDAHSRQTNGSGRTSIDSVLSSDTEVENGAGGSGSNDEISEHKFDQTRVLPTSLMKIGKYANGSLTGGYSGVLNHTGEMPVEDETQIYQAALQGLSQPRVEIDVPDGILAIYLLRHQKIALAWMIQKETRGPNCLGGFLADDQGLGKTVSVIALTKMQGPRQAESKYGDSQQGMFEPLTLDEDDHVVPKLGNTGQFVTFKDSGKDCESTASSSATWCKGRSRGGTLVVCPASVLRQWAREFNDKVTEEAKLNVLIYHGGNRTRDPAELAKYDVVLTTYSIVSNEVPKQTLPVDDDIEQSGAEKYSLSTAFSISKKRKKISDADKKGKKRKVLDGSSVAYNSGPLARVSWFRVVLDEAQTIKNHRTQVARACCGLRAKRRWCLSGTPIQNAIDDLYSYFRFLRYDPYASYKSFCIAIKYPISRNSIQGYLKLQAVLNTIMLRRTKDTLIDGKPILHLPSKSVYLKKVDFSPEERSFYSSLEADSRSQFKKYADEGTVSQNYANILLMLLRLRQACDHPFLVQGLSAGSVERASLEMARTLPREMLGNLLCLLEPSLAICGECDDPPEDAVVTICGHVFCNQCLSDRLSINDSCPARHCKHQLGPETIFSRATILTCISEDSKIYSSTDSFGNDEPEPSVQNAVASSKIKAALEILYSVCKLNPVPACQSEGDTEAGASVEGTAISGHSSGSFRCLVGIPEKVIVFSQWTSMLDLLEVSLMKSCIKFRRLDGTLSLSSRDKAVREFTTDPQISVMIMSLKAGNLGLNMVAANHVIILDLWWNPTTEDQAIDRAHRIGQTRPVSVSRLTIKDTVEDRILALQEEKRKMVSSAFGDKSGGPASRLTMEDLHFLFMGGSL